MLDFSFETRADYSTPVAPPPAPPPVAASLLEEANSGRDVRPAPDRFFRIGAHRVCVSQTPAMETAVAVLLEAGTDLHRTSLLPAALSHVGLDHSLLVCALASGDVVLTRFGPLRLLALVCGVRAPDGLRFSRLVWRLSLFRSEEEYYTTTDGAFEFFPPLLQN